jgi:UDP-N-acetylglucosamine 2-epimerase (non-hydrolysing)
VKKKILLVFGTRPEAIKMAPVALALARRPGRYDVRLVVTAQHRGLLDQALRFFGLRAHRDLDLMRPGQSLTDVTTRVLTGLEPVFRKERPDLVLVHGDTTTTLGAALAAHYQQIPVGHVEAGLRSGDPLNPFPEETNRRLTDALARWHFAPTPLARRNLRREGIDPRRVFVTGNTGIDALRWGLRRLGATVPKLPAAVARRAGAPFVLVTAHRRENFGAPLENILLAIRDVARARPSLGFVYPVHPNPCVTEPARRLLGREPNIVLTAPLDYAPLIYLMRRCLFVLTDSGGLQEEAPSLGKPVLVLRMVTERPEGIKAGTALLAGVRRAGVRNAVERLLDDRRLYQKMARAVNPYGDGRASRRIIEVLD